MKLSSRGGYILFEATIALVLLTVGAYAVHGVLRQAILTRGQAQDYTTAKFLLEQIISEVEFQPYLAPEKREGRFEGELDRFSWTAEVHAIDIPKPEQRLNPEAEGEFDPEEFKLPTPTLAHVLATVTWQRGGRTFTETMETLFDYTKLWIKKEEPGP